MTIKTLKNSSTSGIDGIKTVHVKALADLISHPLAHLANCIFNTGIFPESLKTSVVVPINKSKDFTNAADYRPISILCTFSKIIEKLLYFRLSQFTDRHKIISNYQYGFRKKCNTQVAAIELIDHVSHQIDCKKKISLVFFGFT
jgi:hypothetical protein